MIKLLLTLFLFLLSIFNFLILKKSKLIDKMLNFHLTFWDILIFIFFFFLFSVSKFKYIFLIFGFFFFEEFLSIFLRLFFITLYYNFFLVQGNFKSISPYNKLFFFYPRNYILYLSINFIIIYINFNLWFIYWSLYQFLDVFCSTLKQDYDEAFFSKNCGNNIIITKQGEKKLLVYRKTILDSNALLIDELEKKNLYFGYSDEYFDYENKDFYYENKNIEYFAKINCL